MAIDTRDRRASVLGLALGLALVLPNPDGLALDQGDRQQTAFCYRGISAGVEAIVPADYSATYQATALYTATWQQSGVYTATWQQTASYTARWET